MRGPARCEARVPRPPPHLRQACPQRRIPARTNPALVRSPLPSATSACGWTSRMPPATVSGSSHAARRLGTLPLGSHVHRRVDELDTDTSAGPLYLLTCSAGHHQQEAGLAGTSLRGPFLKLRGYVVNQQAQFTPYAEIVFEQPIPRTGQTDCLTMRSGRGGMQ
jgi:hypothetical protein